MTEREQSQPAADGDLRFTVTVDEANLILEALGELPFSRVCELISKFQAQGRAQLIEAEDEVVDLMGAPAAAEQAER